MVQVQRFSEAFSPLVMTGSYSAMQMVQYHSTPFIACRNTLNGSITISSVVDGSGRGRPSITRSHCIDAGWVCSGGNLCSTGFARSSSTLSVASSSFARAVHGLSSESHKSQSFGIHVETMMVAESLGFEICEFPVSWRDSDGSKIRPVRDSLRMLLEATRAQRRHKPTTSVRPESRDANFDGI